MEGAIKNWPIYVFNIKIIYVNIIMYFYSVTNYKTVAFIWSSLKTHLQKT